MTIKELRDQRAQIVARQDEMLKAIEAENRSMTSEEEANFDKANADAVELRKRIERLEAVEGMKADLRESANGAELRGMRIGEEKADKGETEMRQAFARYIFNGSVSPEMREDSNINSSKELRSVLGVGLSGSGAYLAPKAFEKQLLEYVTKQNVMRQLADVSTYAAETDIPYVASATTAYMVDEGDPFTASTPTFNVKTMKAYKAGCLTYITHEALEDIVINIEQWINQDFGRAFAELEESQFIAGTGVKQPTGILVGGTNALTTGTSGAVTADEILALLHSVNMTDRKNGTWVMSDSAALAIKKLKTTNGEYIWQPGMQLGQPDVLFGKPVAYSDSMPAFAAGAKAIAFGNMKKYRIGDRAGLYMQRLNEVQAVNGQIGYLAYRRYDANVMDANAIKYLTVKA